MPPVPIIWIWADGFISTGARGGVSKTRRRGCLKIGIKLKKLETRREYAFVESTARKFASFIFISSRENSVHVQLRPGLSDRFFADAKMKSYAA
jgi:hypothetical protein